MEKIDFQAQIAAHLAADDLVVLGRDVAALRSSFEDYYLEIERQEQVKKIEGQAKGDKYEMHDFQYEKDLFYAAYKSFQEKRKIQVNLKTTLETENLRLKRSLIQQLKNVIENEEKIGSAFNAHKEIHETWKKIGDIPRDKREDIQKEYSRLIEIFFYNIKIYRELKANDYKRNSQLKQDIIFKLKNLRNSSLNVRDLESSLRGLQNEWEEIGPVNNEEWEVLKNSYWEAVRFVYEKTNQFYDEQRNELAANLLKKRAIISELSTLLESTSTLEKAKDWEKATEKVIQFQAAWKLIGFGPKKDNDKVWKEFREKCDLFFTSKKEFNKSINLVNRGIADQKRELIEQAKLCKDSTDWKTTADKIISLQKNWKSLGSAGQKYDNKLWADFRSACDDFFTARERNFAAQDAALIENLNTKNDLIASLNEMQLPESKSEALAVLRNASEQFSTMGHVPLKNKNDVYERFKKAMDAKYSSLKLEADEKDRILFQAKIDTLGSSPERQKLLTNEKNEIRKQMDALGKEIIQMENNLGFFARSKGADQLRKEVEGKVQVLQTKIDGLKKKLKLIPHE
jgi:hypothetical protein